MDLMMKTGFLSEMRSLENLIYLGGSGCCGLTRLHRKPGFLGFLVFDDLFTKMVKPGFGISNCGLTRLRRKPGFWF
jgi:hypothetical protein